MGNVAVVIIALASVCAGVVIGWAIHVRIAREIIAENRRLRAGLRAIRWGKGGVGPALLRFIDRVTGDETAS